MSGQKLSPRFGVWWSHLDLINVRNHSFPGSPGSRDHIHENLIISFSVVVILLTIYLKCYSMVNVNLGMGYSENVLGFGGN